MRDAVKLTVYALLRPIVPRLPRRMFYSVCDALGDANHVLHGALRRRVRDNLRTIYAARCTEAEIARLTRMYFRQRAAFVLENALLPSMDAQRFAEWFVVDGADIVDRVVREKRGAVIPLVHFGPFTLVGAWLNHVGLAVTDIAVDVDETEPSPAARRITRERYAQWQAGGGALIDRARFLRSALMHVRAGGAVSVFFDAPPVAQMTSVHLLGRDTRVHRGPVALALKTGAPILLMAATRGRDRRIHVHVARAFAPVATGDRAQDIRANMQVIADFMAEWIDRDPTQWIMWKEIDERWVVD